MDVLVVGGTRFVGRHVVEALLGAGHDVTLLNRGTSNPGLFADVPRIVADRDGDLAALQGTSWDAVVDVAAYFPRQVRSLLGALGHGVGRYVYVSTVSVYGEHAPLGITEDAEVERIVDDADHATITGATYGPLKAGCEQVAAELLADPARLAVLRLGLVVGPWDHTGRFTYWPARFADRAAGEVLAPGDPRLRAQVVDARDIAAFTARVLAGGLSGTYNVVAPAHPWGDWLVAVAEGAGAADADLTWVDEGFLLEHGVEPWSDLPLWLPAASSGVLAASHERAVAAGLTPRPVADSARDVLAWLRAEQPAAGAGAPAGIDRARERELLDAWHARS